MRSLLVIISLLSFIIPPLSVQAATNGQLVKIASNSAVYYVFDGKRYAFPNESVFFSWYSGFDAVTTVTLNELAGYPLAGNVTYRPGQWLVKIQTDPKVYTVSRYGILRWIGSEQIAATLYGERWQTNVRDIPDTFFLNYQIGTPVINASEYSVNDERAVTDISQNFKTEKESVNSKIRSLEEETIAKINAYRVSKGFSALLPSDEIANIARTHSANMETGDVPFGHTGLDQRLELIAKVMTVESVAENVAYNMGMSDPIQTAVEGWIESAGHRKNIENASYNRTGVGIVINNEGEYYLTQLFATEISER